MPSTITVPTTIAVPCTISVPSPSSTASTRSIWTISSSSPTPSSPPSPAFIPAPALSPASARRRRLALSAARQRGWLTAPRARHVMDAAAAAHAAGTLPDVRFLPLPPTTTLQVDHLCDGLSRVLHWSEEQDGEDERDDEREEEQETEEEGLRRGGRVLRGASVWLKRGAFDRAREHAALRLLCFFDDRVLGGLLLSKTVGGMPRVSVSWSVRLYKTAGLTYMKRRAITGERTALIQLSTKVVDEPSRLYNTLAHEMCHAASWIIDDQARPPHGAVFKSWARKFSRWDPSLTITTCHDYLIRYKFNYECGACGQSYGRHSRSINTTKQVCGRCKGSLTLLKS